MAYLLERIFQNWGIAHLNVKTALTTSHVVGCSGVYLKLISLPTDQKGNILLDMKSIVLVATFLQKSEAN